MIRATELSGRAVVDMDAAEKLGRIDKVIIDPEARRVAAFRLSQDGALFRHKTHITVRASAVYAIGPDAITVRHVAGSTEVNGEFDGLPRVSDVIGRKVVSRDGRLLGSVQDVLISGADGHIVGYELADSDFKAQLQSLFVDNKRPHGPYLRADADLRAGRDLIVAPDDAICRWEADHPEEAPAAREPSNGPRDVVPPADLTSNWFRRDLPDEGRTESPKPIR